MIEHAWTVLCKKAIVDPQTGNITLVETVEQINATGAAPDFPALAPMEMELVSLWYRTDIEVAVRGQGRIALIGPDGHVVGDPQTLQLDLTTFVRARTIAKLPGLPVTGAGVYRFQVELSVDGQEEWRIVARVPVQFTVQDNRAIAAAPNHAVQ